MLCSWEGPLGTPPGLAQWKRASSRVEAGTSGFLSISDSDLRVPAVLGQESQAWSCVEEWNSACLSSCTLGDRPRVELCVEPVGFSGRCTGVSVPLRVVPSSTGLPSKPGSYEEQTGKLGSFGIWHHPRGYVSNFLVRLASS